MADEAVDAGTWCIKPLVDRAMHFTVPLGWDLRRCVTFAQVMPGGVAFVALSPSNVPGSLSHSAIKESPNKSFSTRSWIDL
jgi:hypothetical protein